MAFAAKLSAAQIQLARRIERAGLASYSQAVKAFERRENARITEWKAALAAQEQAS